MERSLFFYFLLGLVLVGVGQVSDRLLKDRMTSGARNVVSLLLTVLAALILVLIARPLGL